MPTWPRVRTPLRQRAGDQHRRGARSPAPSAAAPGPRPGSPRSARSATVKPGRLGPAAVVPRHHAAWLIDAGGVGGELAARRRQVAQIGSDRVEQRAQAALVGLPPGLAELGAQEVQPLAEPLDRRAVDPPAPAVGQAVSSALFLAPPECVSTSITSGGRRGRPAGRARPRQSLVASCADRTMTTQPPPNSDGAVSMDRSPGLRSAARTSCTSGRCVRLPARSRSRRPWPATRVHRPLDQQLFVADDHRHRATRAGRGGGRRRGAWLQHATNPAAGQNGGADGRSPRGLVPDHGGWSRTGAGHRGAGQSTGLLTAGLSATTAPVSSGPISTGRPPTPSMPGPGVRQDRRHPPRPGTRRRAPRDDCRQPVGELRCPRSALPVCWHGRRRPAGAAANSAASSASRARRGRAGADPLKQRRSGRPRIVQQRPGDQPRQDDGAGRGSSLPPGQQRRRIEDRARRTSRSARRRCRVRPRPHHPAPARARRGLSGREDRQPETHADGPRVHDPNRHGALAAASTRPS